MDARLTQALDIVRNAGANAPDEDSYLEACSYLVDHRDALPHRIFIDLPGGLSGNQDPRWKRVKSLTESRCNCGNERTIVPLNPRTAYERSTAPAVTLRKGETVYLKPVGGDKASTYIALDIMDADAGPAFTSHADPFSGSLNFADLFSGPKGYMLDKLAQALAGQKEPAVMSTGKGGTPLFAIESADPGAGTVVILLDKDVEVFDPKTWTDRHA